MAAKYFLALLVACAAVQVIYGFPSLDFGDIINKIKEKAEDVVKKVKEEFGSVQDIWDKIKGRFENVWDEIKKKIEDIISGIKGKLTSLKMDAKTDGAKDCIAQAEDELAKDVNEIAPKMQACMEQVKKDMEPMMTDMKNEMDKIAPKMSDEVKTCMQLGNWQQCIEGATQLAPEIKSALQNLFGDAGKVAQMMPAEAQKAMQCAAPVMSDMKEKGEAIVSGAVSCMKNAIGA